MSKDAGTDSVGTERIVSVDTLRGLTIMLMVFVNDLGSAAPAWLLHIQPSDADGMTLADIVFPFFLFIVGVSIPLAFATARSRGHSTAKICQHVMLRTAGLLVMGLVGVNRHGITSLSPTLWGLLCYVCIIFAWCIVPRSAGRKRSILLVLKVSGILGLIALLALYRREPVDTRVMLYGEVEGWTWMQTQWWGILGLIGWAYLVAAVVFLLVGSRREWIAVAAGLLMVSFVASQSGGFFERVENKAWLVGAMPLIQAARQALETLDQYVSLGSQLGSLPSIVVCGTLLGRILTKDSDISSHADRIRWAMAYAVLLLIAGVMTDTFAGVNKIAATPTWCFWCSSFAVAVWTLLYWIMDVKQYRSWATPIVPAGANPLIAYLVHPILLFILSLTGVSVWLRAYAISETPTVVILGSLVMSTVVCGITAAIAGSGVRVRI